MYDIMESINEIIGHPKGVFYTTQFSRGFSLHYVRACSLILKILSPKLGLVLLSISGRDNFGMLMVKSS